MEKVGRFGGREGLRGAGGGDMQPMLRNEIGAARATQLREQAERGRMVKAAKAAKASRRQEEIRTPRMVGILPWRSVARGRAVGKVRTRTATDPC